MKNDLVEDFIKAFEKNKNSSNVFSYEDKSTLSNSSSFLNFFSNNTESSSNSFQSIIIKILEVAANRLYDLDEKHLSLALNYVINCINNKLDEDLSKSKKNEYEKCNNVYDLINVYEKNKKCNNNKQKKATVNTRSSSNSLDKSYLKSKLSTSGYFRKESDTTNADEHKLTLAPVQLNNFIVEDSLIEKIDCHDFNIFQLSSKASENTLNVVANLIFIKNELYKTIDYNKYINFITEIEKGYRNSNFYHNSVHAADVTQSCLVYVKYSNLSETLLLQSLDLMCLYMSAIVHDFKHPGLNNNYLINSQSDVAITYNDNSVLENFHISEAFKLINSDTKYNIFSNYKLDEMKTIRKRMVNMVLNTDMMFHGKLLGILKTKVEVPQDLSTMDSNNLFNHQQDYLNNILHAADISNAAKPTNVYIKWAEKVINEFWQQGDLEKEKKLPISFLCDRETVTIAKSQIGFIDNVILPYFSAFNNSLNGKLSFLINYIEKNRLYYTKQKELDDMKNEI